MPDSSSEAEPQVVPARGSSGDSAADAARTEVADTGHELAVSRSTVDSWRSGRHPIPRAIDLALVTLARRKPPPPGTGGRR